MVMAPPFRLGVDLTGRCKEATHVPVVVPVELSRAQLRGPSRNEAACPARAGILWLITLQLRSRMEASPRATGLGFQASGFGPAQARVHGRDLLTSGTPLESRT